MTILLIIIAVVAVVYVFAAVVYYYGFTNWHPLCGSKGSSCALKNPPEAGTSAGSGKSRSDLPLKTP